MNKRALLLCAALALALGAPLVFAAPQQLAQADPTAAARAAAKVKHADLTECDAQNCSVSVTASACTSVSAKPDTLAVIKTHKGVLLLWTVDTAGYTFDKKSGIVFKDAGQDQFKCKARAKATEYECANKNGNAAMTEYKYGITLRDAGGAACKLDPIIINGY